MLTNNSRLDSDTFISDRFPGWQNHAKHALQLLHSVHGALQAAPAAAVTFSAYEIVLALLLKASVASSSLPTEAISIDSDRSRR